MHRNCSTCRNNDDKHRVLCAECIRIGGASGLPHYAEGTPEEIAINEAMVVAKRQRGEPYVSPDIARHFQQCDPIPTAHPEEVLAKMDAGVEDMVNLPKHYARFAIEPIRFVVENFGVVFLVGNIIKYVMRYDAKNGIEDLKKARRYLDMLIAFLQGDPDWWKVKA